MRRDALTGADSASTYVQETRDARLQVREERQFPRPSGAVPCRMILSAKSHACCLISRFVHLYHSLLRQPAEVTRQLAEFGLVQAHWVHQMRTGGVQSAVVAGSRSFMPCRQPSASPPRDEVPARHEQLDTAQRLHGKRPPVRDHFEAFIRPR